MVQAVLQIDAGGRSAPAGIHLSPGVAWWCSGKVHALMFPGGRWILLLRPATPEATWWQLVAVPREGTLPNDRSGDGHLLIAHGDDPIALRSVGWQWETSAKTLAMRMDAVTYWGTADCDRCGVHGAGCDMAAGSDTTGRPHRDSDSDTPRDSDSDTSRDSDSDTGGRP